MPRSETAPRVAAVISAYRPDNVFPARVAAIAEQVSEVIVVDDGGRGDQSEVLYEVARRGATVICLLQNSGIAAALNAGVDAAAAGNELVVTLDQDSAVPTGFVSALENEHVAAVQDGVRVGSVSPASVAGLSQASGTAVHGHLTAVRPIQSGTLYLLQVLRETGPFDERLFIDLVDTEYALRLQSAGMEALIAPGLDLPHRLGAARQMYVLGKSVTVGLSAPFRYYYRARNRILVGARYLRTHPGPMVSEAVRDIFQLSWSVAFAKQPFRMWTVLLAGIIDGMRRRGGRIPESVASRARTVRWRGRDVTD